MIKEYLLNPDALDMWLHQNGSNEIIDFREGCLLDSFIISTKRGTAAIYERYCTSWTSNYRIEWEKYPSDKVWENWEKFCTAYDEEFGGDEDEYL